MIFWATREAALAADLIKAWKTLRGGCASSRLDHGRTDGGSEISKDKRFLFFAIAPPKSGFWLLGDAFEVRKATGSVAFAGERPDDSPANGRRGTGRSPANPMLLAASLTSKASLSIQSPDLGVDIAKIRSPS